MSNDCFSAQVDDAYTVIRSMRIDGDGTVTITLPPEFWRVKNRHPELDLAFVILDDAIRLRGLHGFVEGA